jgi:hypothetical protein
MYKFKMSEDIDTRCVENTLKGERCKREKIYGDLCERHDRFNKKKEGFISYDGPSKMCTHDKHYTKGSIYRHEKVPIENFRNPNKDTLYTTCIDCRKSNKIQSDKRNKKKEEIKEKYQKISKI